jgi:hypothetical protein
MNEFKFLFLLLVFISNNSFAAEVSFRDKYKMAAKDMVPIMQIVNCADTPATNKHIIECTLNMPNSLLTLDVVNGKLDGIWLMYDRNQLEHPSDMLRVGGMLLRALRGTSPAGNHLQVATDLYSKSSKVNGKTTCTVDSESAAKFCVDINPSGIVNLTLTPIAK